MKTCLLPIHSTVNDCFAFALCHSNFLFSLFFLMIRNGTDTPWLYTTLDTIQHQQQYSKSCLHGIKRTHGHIDEPSRENVVFRDITNIGFAHDVSKRQRLDVVGKNRIEASTICNVTDEQHNYNSENPSRKAIISTPGPSQNPLLSLSHPRYGLPDTLVRNFASLGINSIYPWQSSCLLGRGLLDGEKNLVYTAPTGGGKSLVADVLMLKRVIEVPSKKAILVLPYVALVQEKLKFLRKVVEGVQKTVDTPSQLNSQLPNWRKRCGSSVRVVGFFGGNKARASWSDVDVAVCTIEKVCRLIFCRNLQLC